MILAYLLADLAIMQLAAAVTVTRITACRGVHGFMVKKKPRRTGAFLTFCKSEMLQKTVTIGYYRQAAGKCLSAMLPSVDSQVHSTLPALVVGERLRIPGASSRIEWALGP